MTALAHAEISNAPPAAARREGVAARDAASNTTKIG